MVLTVADVPRAAIEALLVFLLVPWVPESIVRPRNGARRWINLVVTDFQPSELAKIAYVLVLANYLRYRSSYRRFLGLLIPLALTFIPMGLILVEPDLGTVALHDLAIELAGGGNDAGHRGRRWCRRPTRR